MEGILNNPPIASLCATLCLKGFTSSFENPMDAPLSTVSVHSLSYNTAMRTNVVHTPHASESRSKLNDTRERGCRGALKDYDSCQSRDQAPLRWKHAELSEDCEMSELVGQQRGAPTSDGLQCSLQSVACKCNEQRIAVAGVLRCAVGVGEGRLRLAHGSTVSTPPECHWGAYLCFECSWLASNG